ncbi:cold shock domain-containing protein [Zooshikella harenae]|uniref:Cold shock domain-containing protein n=1 Tax=Zooshikella harenae TaxID=2827238 RepID=A0ABS5ZAG0_9GAMM|nr:cold shock domain-containing protein [Zooshikella harenae]MBU2711039.1 cold shock domain-containing protein [Zooshikella harenae]
MNIQYVGHVKWYCQNNGIGCIDIDGVSKVYINHMSFNEPGSYQLKPGQEVKLHLSGKQHGTHLATHVIPL